MSDVWDELREALADIHIHRDGCIDRVTYNPRGRETMAALTAFADAHPNLREVVTCGECRWDHDCSIQHAAQAGAAFWCAAGERRQG